MPPRIARSSVSQRYSAAPTSTRRNGKRKDRTRDAFAIASTQDPEHTRIRQHRLGESELDADEPRHKRRRMLDEEAEGEDDAPPSNGRRLQQQNVSKGEMGPDGFAEEDEEEGSDGEGNHWRVGPGDEESGDESVDSDEAFGESDEERFEDYAFRGSKGSKAKSTKRTLSQSYSGEDALGTSMNAHERAEDDLGEESDDSLGSEAIDLATALDQYDENEDEDEMEDSDGNSGEARNNGAAEVQSRRGINRQTNPLDDDWAGFSDSETPDGQPRIGFTSEDEDEESSFTDDEAGNPPPRKSLQDVATSFAQGDVADEEEGSDIEIKPGALMEALQRMREQGNGIKRPKPRKKDAPARAPLEPRQQAKVDRAAAYSTAKKALTDNWQDIVKNRRRAEHLHFPLVDPNEQHPQGENKLVPATTTQPRNELEATIEGILQESGLAHKQKNESAQRASIGDEDAGMQGDGLPAQKKLSKKEERARLEELRKAREMIYREEQRAKRIKKIKSKAYRRIHRKERDRHDEAERQMLREAGMLSEDENDQEKHDRRRAEERMGGRHKNSAWARSVKSTGRAAWDDDARDGLNDMARRDDELRARLQQREESSDQSIAELDSSDDETRFKLREKADELSGDGPAEPPSKLASLKFMQRADEARRKQNDRDIRRLRRELDGVESESESEKETNMGRRIFGPQPTDVQPQKPQVQRSEFEEAEDSASDLDVPAKAVQDEDDDQAPNDIPESKSIPSKEKKHLPKPTKGASQVPSVTHAENNDVPPDSDAAAQNSSQPSPPSSKPTASPLNTNGSTTVPFKAPSPQPDHVSQAPPQSNDYDYDHEDAAASDADLTLHANQAGLIAAAFGHDDSATKAFTTEKQRAEDSEDDQYESTALPGWGSWAGAGLSQRATERQKRNAARFAQKTRQGVSKDRRKDRGKANVILSEKKVRKNAKYLASQLPHPFESKAQYERSLRLPLGKEWNTKETVQRNSMPRVMVRQGVIEPMRKGLV